MEIFEGNAGVAHSDVVQPVDVGLEGRALLPRSERLGQVGVEPRDVDMSEDIRGTTIESAFEVGGEESSPCRRFGGGLIITAGS